MDDLCQFASGSEEMAYKRGYQKATKVSEVFAASLRSRIAQLEKELAEAQEDLKFAENQWRSFSAQAEASAAKLARIESAAEPAIEELCRFGGHEGQGAYSALFYKLVGDLRAALTSEHDDD